MKKKTMKNSLLNIIHLFFHGKWKALFIETTEDSFLQFFRYLFVGGFASIVDWGTLAIFLHFSLYYLVGTACGFIFGLITNFVLSKIMIFKKNVGIFKEFSAFAGIGVVGLIITMLLMKLAVDGFKLPAMPSRVCITVIVLFWNFIARKIFYQKSS